MGWPRWRFQYDPCFLQLCTAYPGNVKELYTISLKISPPFKDWVFYNMWAADWVTPAFQDSTFSKYNVYFIQNLCGLTNVLTKFSLNILLPLQAFGAYRQIHISFNIQKHMVKTCLLCSKKFFFNKAFSVLYVITI